MNPLAPVNLPEGAFLGTGELFLSTVVWIGIIATVACLVGWCAGAGLVRPDGALRRWRAIAVTVPLCLPAYLAFWSLWHQTEPTSWLGDRVLRWGAAVQMREGVLVLSMSLWAAPFVAWAVAMGRMTRPDPTAALRSLDGAGSAARSAAAWRRDRAALALGWLVAFLALMGESVSFDLAQVRTYGFELRSLDLTGAAPSTIVVAAWPSVVLVLGLLAGAIGLARGFGHSGAGAGARAGLERASTSARIGFRDRSPAARAFAALAWASAVAIAMPPLLLLAHRWSWHDLQQFMALHSRPTTTSLALAVGMGAIVASIAVGLRSAWQAQSALARAVASGFAFALLVGASVPATLVVVMHERLWNNDTFGPAIYDTQTVVVLGLVTRVGVAGVLCAALIARSGAVERLVRLDRPRSLASWWKIRRPAILAIAAAAGVVGAGLAFSEIAVSSRLVPPGMELLATSTLNAIHYQQPEIVLISASGAVLLGAAGAVVVVLAAGSRRSRVGGPAWSRRSLRAFLPVAIGAIAFLGCAPLGGCGERSAATLPTVNEDPNGTPPIPCIACFGTSGFGPGQFRTPRGAAYDETRRLFYVVDKEARIQRFSDSGVPEASWSMPESRVGKPVGLSVHPDGRVFVADTHYNRVLIFDRDGHELARFGSYGKELGQFIYPTDIAFGNDGRIYVGEYGGNDRVQMFSPTLEAMGSIGSAGVEEGQLSRPQGLAFDRTANELYVADSNNHRIVIYDPDGKRLRQFGEAGIQVGQLSYPRGIVFCGDGSIMVVEFGNHRVQRFVARAGTEFGTSLGIWGGMSTARLPSLAPGRGVSETDLAARARSIVEGVSESDDGSTQRVLDAGRLQYPWDMAGRPGHVMILDSGHDRVMIARLPS